MMLFWCLQFIFAANFLIEKKADILLSLKKFIPGQIHLVNLEWNEPFEGDIKKAVLHLVHIHQYKQADFQVIGQKKRYHLKVFFKVLQSCLAVKEALKSQQILTPEQTHLITIEHHHAFNPHVWSSFPEGQYEVIRNLEPSECISKSALRRKPDISAGEQVFVTVQSDYVQLTTLGKMITPGYYHQLTTVQLKNKQIHGVLKPNRTVEMQ